MEYRSIACQVLGWHQRFVFCLVVGETFLAFMYPWSHSKFPSEISEADIFQAAPRRQWKGGDEDDPRENSRGQDRYRGERRKRAAGRNAAGQMVTVPATFGTVRVHIGVHIKCDVRRSTDASGRFWKSRAKPGVHPLTIMSVCLLLAYILQICLQIEILLMLAGSYSSSLLGRSICLNWLNECNCSTTEGRNKHHPVRPLPAAPAPFPACQYNTKGKDCTSSQAKIR